MQNLHTCRPLTALCAAALILAIASPARAQSNDEPGISLPSVGLTSPSAEHPALVGLTTTLQPDRSVGTAYALSLGTTLGGFMAGFALAFVEPALGISLAVTSVIVGPSLGHFYAGEHLHGGVTLALRAVGVGGTFLLGLGAIFVNFETENPDRGAETALAVGAVVCLVGTLGLTIYDLIDSGFAVKRRNARQRSGLASLRVVPMVAQGPHGEARYGVHAALRF